MMIMTKSMAPVGKRWRETTKREQKSEAAIRQGHGAVAVAETARLQLAARVYTTRHIVEEVQKVTGITFHTDDVTDQLDILADDESFDIHMKAQARYADLDIAVGRWDDAAKKLQDLLAKDTDWRRRTWAQSWLGTLSNMAPQARILAACGPKALERVLVSLEKPEAARKAGAVVPGTMAGLSLAEMESVAALSGAPMRAFKVSDPANVAQAASALANLTLPAIVHLDGNRDFDRSKSYFATRELKRAPFVALDPDLKKKGKVPSAIKNALRADRGGPAMSLFKSGLSPSGHYLVLEVR